MTIVTYKRVDVKDLVAKQLPEFVRAEYPTFVAFLEAYYEYLDQNSVDLAKIRDIDTTLDEFIKHFKTELAHNYPISDSYDTERYLLKHVRDQYLAKGSEASYKLLFRLLFSKDVYLDYPGRQMLRISDGRWQQDVSLFVRVELGDPFELIGKIVDVQTSKRLNIDTTVSRVTANVENVVKVSDNIYEFFLDRNFYGDIQPGDVVKYQSTFQAQVLPCTAKIRIQNRGQKFKPGQVFQIQFGEGSALWFKVLTTDADGGIEKVDIIKFGIGYETDFSIELLPSSAVTSQKKITKSAVAVTFSIFEGVVGGINIINPGGGYQFPPDVRFSDEGTGAVAHTVIENGQIVDIVIDSGGTGYTEQSFVIIVPKPNDLTGAGGKVELVLGTIYNYDYDDRIEGFTEGGYGNWGDYWDVNESGRGAKATAIIQDNVITKINVTNPGEGYNNALVEITDSIGSGTSASAMIHDGVITEINVTAGGHDYSRAEVIVTDPTGSGLEAEAVIVDGEVTDINIVKYGYGYTNPIITIHGDGVSAGAAAVVKDGAITSIKINNYGFNYTNPTVTVSGDGSGATAQAIVEDGGVTNLSLVSGGANYKYPSPYIDICIPLDSYGIPIENSRKATARAIVENDVIVGVSITDPGTGYTKIKPPPVTIAGAYGYANGAYVGSIARQFYVDARDTIDTNQALLNISLDAVAKYPGYYKTNDGFLNDSMFIQDSFYYQAFSYVIRIDEQLESYASVVRTMLHPSGMALFGEYSINNQIALSVALSSLVKSLGVTLNDFVTMDDSYEFDENGIIIRGSAIKATKDLSSSNITLDDATQYSEDNRLLKGVAWSFTKSSEETVTITGSDLINFKPFYDNVLQRNVFGIEKVFGFVGSAEKVFPIDDGSFKRFTKVLTDSTSLTEEYTRKLFTKSNTDFQPISEQHTLSFTLNTILDPLSGIYPETGFVTLDPYDQGSFFSEHYANERPSSW